MLGACLDGGGLLGAGQTCQEVEDRHRAGLGLGGNEDRKLHVGPGRGGAVAVKTLGAATARLLAEGFDV